MDRGLRRRLELEVGALTEVEARAWLGRALPEGRRSATLAELFGWRDERALRQRRLHRGPRCRECGQTR